MVFLSAASAYTIALADDQIASKIATEVIGNAMHRMGHQLSISSNAIADATHLAYTYKKEKSKMDAVFMNEKETLASIAELGSPELKLYLKAQSQQIERIYEGNENVVEEQMKLKALSLSIPAVELNLTEFEKKALEITPIPTQKAVGNGYGGYRKSLYGISKADREKFLHPSLKRSTGELRLLCNGQHNALEIKKMIEAQYPYDIEMEDVLNYLEILKIAGLVEYK